MGKITKNELVAAISNNGGSGIFNFVSYNDRGDCVKIFSFPTPDSDFSLDNRNSDSLKFVVWFQVIGSSCRLKESVHPHVVNWDELGELIGSIILDNRPER